MAVRLGKYYLYIKCSARKFLLCAEIFVKCAEMLALRNIYISGALKYLYDCAEILWLPGNILLARKY